MAAVQYAFGYTNTTAVERQPIYATDVWMSIADIPPVPNPLPGAKYVRVVDTPTAATPVVTALGQYRYSCSGLSTMIPGNYGLSPSYAPSLRDSAGHSISYNPAAWVADSELQVIQFPAPPAGLGYTSPFFLTYWKYTGETANSVSGGGGGGPYLPLTGGNISGPLQLAAQLYDGATLPGAAHSLLTSTGSGVLWAPPAFLPLSGGTVSGPLGVGGPLLDGAGGPGAAGSLLTSTGSGVAWATLSVLTNPLSENVLANSFYIAGASAPPAGTAAIVVGAGQSWVIETPDLTSMIAVDGTGVSLGQAGTGYTVRAPTVVPAATSDTQIATTAFVHSVLGSAGVSSVSGGAGISVTTVSGVATVTNTGVLSVSGGAGITVTTASGVATVTATGAGSLSVSGGAGISVTTVSGVATVTNTGVLSVSGGAGISVTTVSGVATIASSGTTTISVTDTDASGTFYPTFVSASGAGQTLQVDTAATALTYSPSTGTLTATSLHGGYFATALTDLNGFDVINGAGITADYFIGALQGNADTATSAASATNLAGGTVGNIPYQVTVDTTAFLANGAAGTVLTSGGVGANPTWTAPSTTPTLSQVLTAGNTATNSLALNNAGTGANVISLLPNHGAADPHIELTDGTTTNTIDKNGYTTRNSVQNATHFLNFSDASGTGTGAIQKTAGITCNPFTNTVSATTLRGAYVATGITDLSGFNTINGAQITATTFQGALQGNADTATTASKATNLAGGVIGNVPYQAGVNSTALLTNGAAGTVLTSGGVGGAPSWTAPSTAATSVSITETNTAGTYYPTFVSASGAGQTLRADIAANPLSYNPNTGVLTATNFTGSLTGNADTSTRATNIAGGLGGSIPYQSAVNTTALLANGTAGQVLTSAGTTLAPTWGTPSTAATSVSITDTNTAGTYYPTFVSASGAGQTLLADIAANPLSYNPNTGVLTATNFTGSLTGNADTSTTATNIAGGLGGSIPYQSAVNTTALLANGSAGQVLTSAGTTLAPTWTTPSTTATTVSITDTNTAGTYYPTFVSASGSGQTLRVDATTNPLTYNPNTSAFVVGQTVKVDGVGGNGRVAVGFLSGATTQGIGAIAVGTNAGQTTQANNAVAVGNSAGNSSQGDSSVAIGNGAGQTTQATLSVAIGNSAGSNTQSNNSVAIGNNAGQTSQSTASVAVGAFAGQLTQGTRNTAVGAFAGNDTQGADSTAIGYIAGQTNQGSQSVALGSGAGNNTQNTQCVAIGYSAGNLFQSGYSVAVGATAGQSSQGQSAVAVGNGAGNQSQGIYGVAVGNGAGGTNQGSSSTAVGYSAGNTLQGSSSTAVGYSAGTLSQGTSATAVGYNAGLNNQGSQAIAIGRQSAEISQGTSAIAIGYLAGNSSQANYSVAIGDGAGTLTQATNSTAVGRRAGELSQATQSVAVGSFAGQDTQATNSVAVGHYAGNSLQQAQCVAIGASAGQLGQSSGAIAIGYQAGLGTTTSQGANAVAVGINAGTVSQRTNTVAVGNSAGNSGQLTGAVAVGNTAGQTTQGQEAVAIGSACGTTTQGSFAVAIGVLAGNSSQGQSSVAIGRSSGTTSQGAGAVAIGNVAGNASQGANAIAIGVSAGSGTTTGQGANAIAIGQNAGQSSQVANSTVLNASGIAVNPPQAGFYVRPVRQLAATGAVVAYYNTTTFEFSGLSSSRTVKNTIEDFKEDTSVVYGLSPKTYFYNTDPEGGNCLGYIAEEVDELHPRLASHSQEDGNPIGIDYNAIIIFMMEEMKKLREEVKILKEHVNQLEKS